MVEGPPTVRAPVGLLARVDSPVLGECRAVSEALPAFLTLVRPLPGVRPAVLSECRAASKRLSTLQTPAGFLFRVGFLLGVRFRAWILLFSVHSPCMRVLSSRSHGLTWVIRAQRSVFPQTHSQAAAAKQRSSQGCRPPAPHGHPGSHSSVPGAPRRRHPQRSPDRPTGTLLPEQGWTVPQRRLALQLTVPFSISFPSLKKINKKESSRNRRSGRKSLSVSL